MQIEFVNRNSKWTGINNISRQRFYQLGLKWWWIDDEDDDEVLFTCKTNPSGRAWGVGLGFCDFLNFCFGQAPNQMISSFSTSGFFWIGCRCLKHLSSLEPCSQFGFHSLLTRFLVVLWTLFGLWSCPQFMIRVYPRIKEPPVLQHSIDCDQLS